MNQIVDVVNFNADASCLSSEIWLDILKGGDRSLFVQWLQLYIDKNKKVSLGFPGATVADIAVHNPEAIELINKRQDIFEIILRPFAHDIALLRLRSGFLLNLEYGINAIQKEFKNISNYYLPPEFMLTNEQITLLKEKGVDGTFINSARFSEETKKRIPDVPYKVKGLFGTSINCIPVNGRLTQSYLHALHNFDCESWNNLIITESRECLFSWRDGESPFFIPEGLKRESYWLENEDAAITRRHIKDTRLSFVTNEELERHQYKSYPVHSFSAWMKEFRMLGFLNKVSRLEESLQTMTEQQKTLWLMVINSDILSAIEKRAPIVQIQEEPSSDGFQKFTIQRSERGLEGEEYLAILEAVTVGESLIKYIYSSQEPYIIKLRGRIEYLVNLKAYEKSVQRIIAGASKKAV